MTHHSHHILLPQEFLQLSVHELQEKQRIPSLAQRLGWLGKVASIYKGN